MEILGFAAVIFVLFKIYKHLETLHAKEVHTNRFVAWWFETLVKRTQKRIDEVDERLAIRREEELENKLRRNTPRLCQENFTVG